MKKYFCSVCALLLLWSIVLAEPVTRQLYELNLDGETRIGKYTGDVIDGIPDGYGVFVTTNPSGFGWHYIGNWKNGLMHGDGGTYWEDGSIELGTYENGHFIFGYYSYEGAKLELYNASTAVTLEDDSSLLDEKADRMMDGEVTTEPVEVMYIGNKNSRVFHVPNCESVQKMKEKNKVELYSREEAIELGYKPCGACKP